MDRWRKMTTFLPTEIFSLRVSAVAMFSHNKMDLDQVPGFAIFDCTGLFRRVTTMRLGKIHLVAVVPTV